MSEYVNGLIGGLGTLFVAGIGLLGINKRINTIDDRKVSKDAFEQFEKTNELGHQNIQDDLKEMKTDLKELISHKRNGGD